MRGAAAQKQRIKRWLIAVVLLLGAAVASWGLISLSGPRTGEREAALAGGSLMESSGLRRNNIYDRNFDTLALSFRLSSLYARPLEISDPEHTAGELAGILELDRQELLDSLRSERSFVWLTRQAEKEVVDRVLEKNLRGVHVMPRAHRYYPSRISGAHAVGFVKDEQGLAGLELAYDNILRGGISDIRLAAAGVPEGVAAGGGVHLVTTLDLPLQRELEQRLDRAKRAVAGRAAAALVLDIASGAVVAMVSLPAYDPNRFWAAGTEERLNRLVLPVVRPGDLRDIFRRAAALEQGSGDEPAVPGEAFLRKIGLCLPSDLDLLEGRSLAEAMTAAGGTGAECRQLFADSEAQLSAINLVVAFSRLFSGGQAVEPHLVRGFWDGEQFWPRSSGQNGGTYPGSAGQALLAELLKKMGGGGPVLTFAAQTSVSSEYSAVEASLDDGRQNEAANGDREAQLTEPGVQPGLSAAGVPPEQLPAEGRGENPEEARYQAVLLGLAPARQPTLAALIFVDQARLDPALPSLLAGVVRDLDTWSAVIRRPVMPPAAGAVLARENKMYQEWLSNLERGEFQARVAAGRQVERMPDVMGLSLRKALQVLQVSGLRFRVHGSGRVVAQHPPPGASLQGIDEGVIELRVPGSGLAALGRNR